MAYTHRGVLLGPGFRLHRAMPLLLAVAAFLACIAFKGMAVAQPSDQEITDLERRAFELMKRLDKQKEFDRVG